jgi:putative protease
MVLDDPSRLDEAKQLLKEDTGREKTQYFPGGNVSKSFSNNPNTGLYVGKVTEILKRKITFKSEIDPALIKRIRICSPDGSKQIDLTIEAPEISGDEITITAESENLNKNDSVFVIGYTSRSFASRLPVLKGPAPGKPSRTEIQSATQNLISQAKPDKPQLWIRINSPEWLKVLTLEEASYYILNFTPSEWSEILENKPANLSPGLIVAGLPKFISEDSLPVYKDIMNDLQRWGIKSFMTGHISQKEIIPGGSRLFADENCYTFNDAAVFQTKKFGFSQHVYPFENDFKNLFQGKDRSGIVAVFYYPQLFYSRMPVSPALSKKTIKDDNKYSYRIVNYHGITITLPLRPVSILHKKEELIRQGFSNFLIDLSFEQALSGNLNRVLDAFRRNQPIQPSSPFNYQRGLS